MRDMLVDEDGYVDLLAKGGVSILHEMRSMIRLL